MTTVAIHQPQYLPYLGFFHKVAHADVLVVLDTVQFHRRGLQHRNQIKSSQGVQWLTVPVSSGSRERLLDVRVSRGEPWQERHRRALTLNYSRAPSFEEHAEGIFDLLRRPWERLSELDMALTTWLFGVIGVDPKVVYASELDVSGTRTDLLVRLCEAVDADVYLSGPGGRRYMDEDRFAEAGIGLRWQAFENPVYQQLFPRVGFLPGLSAIDPLFCCGTELVRRWVVSDAPG